jgi:hypothetical protein
MLSSIKECKMSDQTPASGGKSYHIGDVGANARVAQGENIQWIEAPANMPELQEVVRQFNLLVEKISADPNLDEDTKTLTVEKTKAVAQAVTRANEEPNKLKIALQDAKGWMIATASYTWDGLNTILKSEAVQKTVGTITDTAVKSAIKAIIGVP